MEHAHVPLTEAWWNAPAFYPSTGVFAFSENLLGLAPIAAPIIAITKCPLLAYNAAFLLSYVLSGLGAYFLGFVLTRRHDAAFVGGARVRVRAYRLSHQQHLQLLSSYWMPVAIAALHLYVARRKARWAILFAASWLLQALACGYYFFYLTLFAALWLAWFGSGRLTVRRGASLSAAWLAAGLALAPVLLGYRTIQSAYGFARSPVEILNYSADIAGLWSAAPDSLLWRLAARPRRVVGIRAVPGLAVVVLAVLALVFAMPRRTQRELVAFYVTAAVLMWLLSLGPRAEARRRRARHSRSLRRARVAPRLQRHARPGAPVDGQRSCACRPARHSPSRASLATRSTLVVVAAAAIVVLLGRLAARHDDVRRAADARDTSAHARARLGLPMRENETETMYGAIAQDRPVFNGYSGYAAPQHSALLDLLDAHDTRILDRLAADGTDRSRRRVGDGSGWTLARLARQLCAPGASRRRRRLDELRDRADGRGRAAPASADRSPVAVAITASANQHDIGAVLDDDLDFAMARAAAGRQRDDHDGPGRAAARARGRHVPGQLSRAVSARARCRCVRRRHVLARRLGGRHRARHLRRRAAVAARGARHDSDRPRRRPLHPPSANGRRYARLVDRRAPRGIQ